MSILGNVPAAEADADMHDVHEQRTTRSISACVAMTFPGPMRLRGRVVRSEHTSTAGSGHST